MKYSVVTYVEAANATEAVEKSKGVPPHEAWPNTDTANKHGWPEPKDEKIEGFKSKKK